MPQSRSAMCEIQRMGSRSGMSNAMKIAMTGKVWKADEMDKMGLFYKVAEPEDVMKEALELAKDIAVNCAPVSCAMTRRLFWTMQSAQSPMDAHEVESLLQKQVKKRPADKSAGRAFYHKT